MRNIRVAVIGAGPAGIYASDILCREHEGATVDIFDRLPAPYGLVRYGVAPDHPRIKEIIKALRRVLGNERIRFFGNVDFGKDLSVDDIHEFYDAVIYATGAIGDKELDIPGIDLPESYGAADFVSWYAGHPDYPLEWPLEATDVAVLGAGNVALDVARMLAKTGEEQLVTEISDNIYQGLAKNPAKKIHVFARRGPAHIKFSPMELRELSHSPNVDVFVTEEGFQIDDAGQAEIGKHKATKLVVDGLLKYLESEGTGAPHQIHIHMMQNPVEVLGEGGHVVAIRTEVTEYNGDGSVRGTGEFIDTPVQAVYRAIGYRSDSLPGVPFDNRAAVIPNEGGRVLDEDGKHVAGTYATGWVKRGPVGLIGHTKSDATETIRNLMEDLDELPIPIHGSPDAVLENLAAKGVEFTTSEGWDKLDAYEIALGEPQGRERIKVQSRDEMMRVSRG
ncbi:MAG TPA: FAD-dependent oxidoreductase [Nocardioides sp.]|nr:FAD-dependent oxidoreductase [Nocardioides sp.]